MRAAPVFIGEMMRDQEAAGATADAPSSLSESSAARPAAMRSEKYSRPASLDHTEKARPKVSPAKKKGTTMTA